MKPLARMIRQLEAVRGRKEAIAAQLEQQQHELRLQALVAALPEQQTRAVFALCAALETGGGAAAAALSAAARNGGNGTPRAHGWPEQLQAFNEQAAASAVAAAMAGGSGGSRSGSGSGGGGGDNALPLGWDPVETARRHLAAGAPAPTTHGLRAVVLAVVAGAGRDLSRVRGGAPDEAAARARLEALRARLVGYMALLAAGERFRHARGGGGGRGSGSATGSSVADGLPGPEPLLEVVMTPLDGSAAPPPDEASWRWAVSQMALDATQAELVRRLLAAWHAKSRAIHAQRAEAVADLRRCAAETASGGGGVGGAMSGGGGDDSLAAHDEIARRLKAAELAYVVHTLVYALALFGSLLSAEQVAALLLASWPYAPSMFALHAALCGGGHGGGGGGGGSGGGGGGRVGAGD